MAQCTGLARICPGWLSLPFVKQLRRRSEWAKAETKSCKHRDASAALPTLLPQRRQLLHQPHPKPAGDVLNILPCHAAGARSARGRPFEGFAPQRRCVDRHAVIIDIALHHGEEFVLAAAVKAQPKAEAVRQRHLLLDRFAGVARAPALILDHVPGQEMPPVRGGSEDYVVGPALDAAFEHGLEGFIRSILRIEGKIVAEYQESVRSA